MWKRALLCGVAALVSTAGVVDAGFTGGGSRGVALTAAQRAAVQAAIAAIRAMAANDPSAQNRATMNRVADCLAQMLKNGRICAEGAVNPGWKGITRQDGSCEWSGDAINIDPACLTAAEPGFSLLVAVLMHEGIHAIQWADGSDYGGTEASEEWVAYSWEKYMLERRLTEQPLTEDQKKKIRERLKVVCGWKDHYCRAAATEREKRRSNAATGNTHKSTLNGNISYVSNYPATGSIRVRNDMTQDTLAQLDTGFELTGDFLTIVGNDGREYLIAGGSNSGAGGGLVVFSDTSGDGVPDSDSRRPIVGGVVTPTSMAALGGRSLVVMDAGLGSDVTLRSVRDLNGDGVPDTILPVPFASEATFPGLAEHWTMFEASPRGVTVSERRNGMTIMNSNMRLGTLTDHDDDGVADTMVASAFNSTLGPMTPVFIDRPMVGDLSVRVEATPGSTVIVFLTDAAGTPIQPLGQNVAPGLERSIPLLQSLAPGQFLRPMDMTNGLSMSAPDRVFSFSPEITGINQIAVLPGTPVRLSGRNFEPSSFVTCSGVPAQVVSRGPNEMIFLAPVVSQRPSGTIVVEVSTGTAVSNIVGLQIHGDCNRNGIADLQDLLAGTSLDRNGNDIPDECECIADMDDGTGTGTPDGGVGIKDLLFYLRMFELGNDRADVDNGSGTGTPDGGVGIEDLLYYLLRYEAGC